MCIGGVNNARDRRKKIEIFTRFQGGKLRLLFYSPAGTQHAILAFFVLATDVMMFLDESFLLIFQIQRSTRKKFRGWLKLVGAKIFQIPDNNAFIRRARKIFF